MASRSTRSRRPTRTTPKQQPEPLSRAKWTASLTKVLVNLMVDQVHKGNKQNNTFGKKTWECISEEFHKNTGLNWEKEQLKNRYAVLRKQFIITKSLLDEPDFKWDEPTGAIVATDEAWNKYIPEHPDAEIIRSTGCSLYKQLCIIFSENGTNGKHYTDGADGPDLCSQPLSMFKGKDSSSEFEEVIEMTDDLDKIQHTAAPKVLVRKRGRRGIDDVIANAISEMAAASKLRANAIKQYNERFSITDCVKALDEIQGVDDRVYLAALDLFNGRNARETFLSLKIDKRLAWLHSKCSALSNFC